MMGIVFDIKEMAVHDGPGIRTTVFFKGCPLRCVWCHNPEGLSPSIQLMVKEARCRHCGSCMKQCDHELCQPFGRCVLSCPENCLEIAGRQLDAQTLAEELKKSADILGNMFGGFTFSGGEPLAQPDFLKACLNELKGYHLCIETSGYAEPEIFCSVLEHLDYVIMDIKLADSKLHLKYTGVDNKKILDNFNTLKNSGKPFLIRTPLIPGITDTADNLKAIEKLLDGCPWEKLPYNAAAGAKYKMLNMEYPLNQL